MSLPLTFVRLAEALQGVLPDASTPFTWSVLGPAAARQARAFFADLGYQLPPEQAVWQLNRSQTTLNETALAQAEEAVLAAAAVASASLSERLLGGEMARPTRALIRRVLDEAPGQFAAVQRWRGRVQSMQWRQATVLQIMEEIEPQAEAALAGQTALLALAVSSRQLAAWLADHLPHTAADLLPRLWVGGDGASADASYRYALWDLERTARADHAASAWLQQGAWQTPVPAGDFRAAFTQFLERYGDWAASPLEAASPRWREAPERLLADLAARLTQPASPAPLDPATAEQQRSAAAAAAAQQLGLLRRRHFEAAMAEVQRLFHLASEGRAAAVTVIDTARTWALGAAHEVVADGRLAAVEDVFLLELEELKQIMTGEWSSPEQVRPLVEARRTQ